jgi:hypothetical protein
MPASMAGEHTLALQTLKTTIVTLDKKYLPDPSYDCEAGNGRLLRTYDINEDGTPERIFSAGYATPQSLASGVTDGTSKEIRLYDTSTVPSIPLRSLDLTRIGIFIEGNNNLPSSIVIEFNYSAGSQITIQTHNASYLAGGLCNYGNVITAMFKAGYG